MTHTPVTIVVEWDNARLSEADRSIRLLEQLDLQVRALGRPAEIIVCYDGTELDRVALAELVRRHLAVPWRLEASRGEYYALKNYAASLSTGDPIVFVDSDVVPESGWLVHLLSCFDDPDVEVACGSTYIDPATLLGKAFALFWFYPLRPRRGERARTMRFYANNVAFRRRTFERFPFPLAGQASRGSCLALATQLADAGIPIWSNSAARMSHPPPNGLHHFIVRALAQGRDRFLRERPRSRSRLGALLAIGARLARNLARSAREIGSGYRRVGVPLWQLPAIAVIATAYYGLFFCGEVATILRGEWMARNFRI